MKSKKPISLSRLVKSLDSVFSKYIRISYANEDGILSCYTCPYKAPWQKMQAGHFISRYYHKCRWDENNVRPQCFVCNIQKKGNPQLFEANLIRELDLGEVTRLKEIPLQLVRGGFPRTWYEEKLAFYSQKLGIILPSQDKHVTVTLK